MVQGTALGPRLYALVAERAAAAAERAAPCKAVTYLDNLDTIVDDATACGAATVACPTRSCQESPTRATASTRPGHRHPGPRPRTLCPRARTQAAKARQLCPLAELRIVRDSAAAAVAYDQRAAVDVALLQEVED